ncbi:hypothetical protein [Terrimonas ferruginea]|uniref:hypothetical protein n=1 Tax=Terrimonas ferruginea TaxID=249 RepID=UPI000408AC2B|nr:hypothetical protein [Terrimonas ferruginea]
MHFKLFFIACLLAAGFLPVNAMVWRVNNTAGIQADFKTLNELIQNGHVSDGDTVYVEGSADNYSVSTSLTKRLIFFGPGYLLNENSGLQVLTLMATINSITLDSLASGSQFYGLRLNQIYAGSSVDNIKIARCSLSVYSTGTAIPNTRMTGWEISQNMLNYVTFSTGFMLDGLVFRNNIVTQNTNFGGGLNMLFRNNIFLGLNRIADAYVSNNYFANINAPVFVNCTVRYNMSQYSSAPILAALPASAFNIVGRSLADVFVNTGSADARYQLTATSPARGAGEPVNGVTPDIGAFGTGDPYRLSGIPQIPSVYAMSVPANVPSSATSMTVTLSTRSNN